MKKPKVLLITPPLTQLNTPYPATVYLKGFLNKHDIQSQQVDLGIELFLKIFNRSEIEALFNISENTGIAYSENTQRIIHLKNAYISTIDLVISYLQKKDSSVGYNICKKNYLPQASRFSSYDQMEWAFEPHNIHEKASFIATLYLEDLADFIQETICPYFEFSKYGEKLVLSTPEFDQLEKNAENADDPISQIIKALIKRYIEEYQPHSICFTIPFPGNLLSALICGKLIKKYFPKINVLFGGGYISTELRQLNDNRIFKFVDYIVLDRGEDALLSIINNDKSISNTFYINNDQLLFEPKIKTETYPFSQMGDPDFSDLNFDQYLSLTDSLNPMHRLWSDGQWNKIVLAYGCYWSRCSFCDIHLKYINCFESTPVNQLIATIKKTILKTKRTGFHFVDEAAPPDLLKELALQLLRENISITWWTNIRFEKGFTRDLCRLLSAAGCIGVSGGIEVANDRLLKKIKKGVTIKQVTHVLQNFKKSGIHVHAYLMYGFPSQTDAETIESLENVRQLFKNNLIQSAYWHQFTLTVHSDIFQQPEKYQIKIERKHPNHFANNDVPFTDILGCDHEQYSYGLKKALYNFMNGIGYDFRLQEWFDFKIPKIKINPNYIKKLAKETSPAPIKENKAQIVWIGNLPLLSKNSSSGFKSYHFFDLDKTINFQCQNKIDEWFCENLVILQKSNDSIKSIKEIDQKLKKELKISLNQLTEMPIWYFLKAHGLVVI